MNVILGTNNKQIDKYISSMDNITVLTQIRKREQIIDRVIDLNPHAIIISKSLSGKTDFFDILKRLRDLKPHLKIVFLYGEKDQEYHLFLDRLISLHIYNFLVGDMDEISLEDVILRDYTIEDVSSYQLSEPEESLPEPEPEKEEPIKEYPLPRQDDDLQVMVVEKIIERERIETEVVGNLKIGIASLFPRAGCTHMALDLAYYLTTKKKDVGVIVSNQVYESLVSYYLLQDKACVIKGVHIYQNEITALNNHKTVVYDYGALNDQNSDRYYTSNLKVLISPVGHWEIDRLTDFLRTSEYVDKIEFALYPISSDYFRELEYNLSGGKARAYMLQHSPELFNKHLINGKTYARILKRIEKNL